MSSDLLSSALNNGLHSFRHENLALAAVIALLSSLGYAATRSFRSPVSLLIPLSAAALWAMSRTTDINVSALLAMTLACGMIALECRWPTSGLMSFGGFVVAFLAALNLADSPSLTDRITPLAAFPAALILTMLYTVVGVMTLRAKGQDFMRFAENHLFSGRR